MARIGSPRALSVLLAAYALIVGCTTYGPRPFPDSGPPDAGAPPDTNRPDAPIPVGRVVVGPDLTPADYTCLGQRATLSPGPVGPAVVHVTDWADHASRAGYRFTLASSIALTSTDCASLAGCSDQITDASGDVSIAALVQPVFIEFYASDGAINDAHMPAVALVMNRTLAPDATRLEVQSLSQRTQTLMINAAPGNGFRVAGTVHDCAGAPVQRARVRLFDGAGDEVVLSITSGQAVLYGDGSGTPTRASERTGIDGTYQALSLDGSDGRIEAWGRLTQDTADVLLGCTPVSFIPIGGVTLVDLDPLAADAPSVCGSRP